MCVRACVRSIFLCSRYLIPACNTDTLFTRFVPSLPKKSRRYESYTILQCTKRMQLHLNLRSACSVGLPQTFIFTTFISTRPPCMHCRAQVNEFKKIARKYNSSCTKLIKVCNQTRIEKYEKPNPNKFISETCNPCDLHRLFCMHRVMWLP